MIRFLPLVLKQVWRHRTRSVLTASGVGVAMFLFVAVQSLQRGVHAATSVTAADTTLVVYRENRFCPATSRLPERYETRIERIPGVASVLPMKIVVSNCGASLDVITFRGVPEGDIDDLARRWNLVSGSTDQWRRRSDAALVGERLAQRRGFKVGDSFDSSGVRVAVAGTLRSSEPQDENVAYVHLPFLQRASKRGGVGIVTEFIVRVSDSSRLEEIARAIDDEFRADQEPTTTRPERAFVAQAGADIVHIVAFTRWLGWGCLAAVLVLVANAIVLSVRDRVKEHAVLQTLGFRGGLIAGLIVGEGLVLGMIGGGLGAATALAVVRFGNFSLSAQGLSIVILTDWALLGWGLAVSAAVGVIAGLFPAWRASRRSIVESFRAV